MIKILSKIIYVKELEKNFHRRNLTNIQGLVILFFWDLYLAKFYINNLINSQYLGDKLSGFCPGN